MTYREYLDSPEWQVQRKRALIRAKGKCQMCSAVWSLQVHHNNYCRRGDEAPEDLIVLCGACHLLFTREGKLLPPVIHEWLYLVDEMILAYRSWTPAAFTPGSLADLAESIRDLQRNREMMLSLIQHRDFWAQAVPVCEQEVERFKAELTNWREDLASDLKRQRDWETALGHDEFRKLGLLADLQVATYRGPLPLDPRRLLVYHVERALAERDPDVIY